MTDYPIGEKETRHVIDGFLEFWKNANADKKHCENTRANFRVWMWVIKTEGCTCEFPSCYVRPYTAIKPNPPSGFTEHSGRWVEMVAAQTDSGRCEHSGMELYK